MAAGDGGLDLRRPAGLHHIHEALVEVERSMPAELALRVGLARQKRK
jgi:hypothetical protein